MRTHRFLIVDVFTDRPLAGNQLAVFTNATGLSDAQMQALAAEIGFSETSFVLPAESGGDVRCRIFTSGRELPFAGHPVLGTAFAMAGPLQSTLMRIETGVGEIPVYLEREGARLVFGRMSQPIPIHEAWDGEQGLLDALGVPASELPIEVYDNGVRHVYVCLPSFEAVARVRPDFDLLRGIAADLGVNVFAVDGEQAKTRMFWTGEGIVEDAATGSAAGPLAVHLSRHGLLQRGRELVISQGEEIGRPSTLYATVHGDDAKIESVEVGGSAVVIARGEFQV